MYCRLLSSNWFPRLSDATMAVTSSYRTVLYCTEYHSTLHCIELQTTLHCTDWQTALYCNELQTTLHCTEFQTSLHWITDCTLFHWVTDCTALHWSELHFTELHNGTEDIADTLIETGHGTLNSGHWTANLSRIYQCFFFFFHKGCKFAFARLIFPFYSHEL